MLVLTIAFCYFFHYQSSSEQVLKHINLEGYIRSKVPSLKACSGQKANGELKSSSLILLANIMQFLQRLVGNIIIICSFMGNFEWKFCFFFLTCDLVVLHSAVLLCFDLSTLYHVITHNFSFQLVFLIVGLLNLYLLCIMTVCRSLE